jgi:hypothetical protein
MLCFARAMYSLMFKAALRTGNVFFASLELFRVDSYTESLLVDVGDVEQIEDHDDDDDDDDWDGEC